LTGVDGFGWRTRQDTVVHVSDALPEWAQNAAVGELLRQLHSTDDEFATMGLPAGIAVTIPEQRGAQPVRL
jgi:hypothetical protein